MNAADYGQRSIFENIELGVGTWAWGDRLMWGYGHGYQEEDIRTAFQSSLNAGINFFDTAETYSQGQAEILLGKLIKESEQKVLVASKYMPYPWRWRKASLVRALKNSLHRLGLPALDLYQIHYPLPPVTIETWMEAMTDVCQSGLVKAVGVSNYNREQMQRAYDNLIRQGIALASNQVEYHLLNRNIEKSGLLKHCQELGITLIAYSPLAMGVLTGKYTPENPPPGVRGGRYNQHRLASIQPLLALMRKIGASHAGITPAQIALNWIICKGALPIPGAKNVAQAEQNARALGWRLTEDEVAALDEASDSATRP